MRFRKFIEDTAGYYDDKEDTRPTGSGRQQEMPGTSMVMGQKDVEAKVTGVEEKDDVIILTLDSDDVSHVSISRQRYEKDEAPKEGNIVKFVFDQDGSLTDYQIIHRLAEPL